MSWLSSTGRLKSQRVAGIRFENDRMIRWLEVLMHSSSQRGGQSAAKIHQVVLESHQLSHDQYTRNPLAYDLRKLRAHGLIERPGNRYVYALSEFGRNAAAMLVIVRNARILRPIAGSLFNRPPKSSKSHWMFWFSFVEGRGRRRPCMILFEFTSVRLYAAEHAEEGG